MLHPPRPGTCIEFHPVVPAFFRREGRELNAARTWIKSFVSRLGFLPSCHHTPVAPCKTHTDPPYASGTACPACTYACSWASRPTSASSAARVPSQGAAMPTNTRATPAQKY